MTHDLRQIAVMFMLGAFLTACGFQLKGSQGLGGSSLAGVSVAVISSNPNGELTGALIQSLRQSGAVLVQRGEAEIFLRIGDEQFARRNLALTAQARAAEVELTVATRFSVRRGDRVLVADTDASVIRNMLDDPGNVVGKTEEMRLLREEMRQDVADQIVRRTSRSLDL